MTLVNTQKKKKSKRMITAGSLFLKRNKDCKDMLNGESVSHEMFTKGNELEQRKQLSVGTLYHNIAFKVVL